MDRAAADSTNRGQRIVRNASALMASQPLTWALTLVFTVLVPRNVGPSAWGEWTIAWAVAGMVKALMDFGINTVVFKNVSRHPQDSPRTIGAVLTLRLALVPVLALGMIGFSLVAGYSEHTRLIVGLVSVMVALGYVGTPVLAGLQAFERMHIVAVANVLGSLILTGGAVVLVKFLALGMVSISMVALAGQALSLGLMWAALSGIVRIRPVLDLRLVVKLLRDGLPYWATLAFFTLYVWVDGIMLSLMGSTQENGWYGAATGMISTLGFLPYAVTTAVFPVLSRSMPTDLAESREVAGRSFRLVVALSLPMSVGLGLVSANLVTTIYGGWFAPAGQALQVLALTLPPVYMATLVNGFVIAADKQVQWSWVMGVMCVLNVLLNLFTIPYFHRHYGNGALGAALALLATDWATGIAALVLLPGRLRPAVRATVPSILASAAATLAMAAAVWPLRGLFLPIPILTGAVVFLVVALPLRVFPRDELRLLSRLAVKLARKPLAPLRPKVQAAGPADP